MSDSASPIRRRIRFFGRVQGVGFRYRARHAAQMYGCTGWCRNEYDGSVLMEIQGDPDAIDQAILSIESGPFVRIDDMRQSLIPLQDERGFYTE